MAEFSVLFHYISAYTKIMTEITYNEVEEFLSQTEFSHQPGQIEISFPIIQRIHRRLQQGRFFKAIKVSGNRIVDGHHRYISYKLLNIDPEIIAGGTNHHKVAFVWSDVALTDIDYDDDDTRQSFADLYDQLA